MGTVHVKALVRLRDGNCCTKCGMTNDEHLRVYSQQLQVHRLTPGSEYTVEGCATFCQGCHAKEPKRPPSGIKKASRPGRTMTFFELPDELAREFEAFVDSFPVGTKAQHVRLALRRHMDHPPEAKVGPLPPTTMEGPAKVKKPKGKGRR